MVENGAALCVLGNHEAKLEKWLRSRDVQITHGLDKTIAELEVGGDPFKRRVQDLHRRAGQPLRARRRTLVVAHAGLKEEMQGRASGAVREFCLYGETTGETDEFGLPVRHNWAADYRGDARRSSTATRRCRRRNGSTTRSASTPVASSAVS